MAEGQWFAHDDVAITVVVVVVEIGAAETCGADRDLELVGGWWGESSCFL